MEAGLASLMSQQDLQPQVAVPGDPVPGAGDRGDQRPDTTRQGRCEAGTLGEDQRVVGRMSRALVGKDDAVERQAPMVGRPCWSCLVRLAWYSPPMFIAPEEP